MTNFDKKWKDFLSEPIREGKKLSENFGLSSYPDITSVNTNPAQAAQIAAAKSKAQQEQRKSDIDSLKKQIDGIRADLSSKEKQLKQLEDLQGQIGLSEVQPTNAAGATPEGSGDVPYSVQPDVPNSKLKN